MFLLMTAGSEGFIRAEVISMRVAERKRSIRRKRF
jgi:hypothetical protein